jgi:hypothetical protein
MSELEARKYTLIRNLREEIRRDMEDYKLAVSWSSKEALKSFIFFPQEFKEEMRWFGEYLAKRINKNLLGLKNIKEKEEPVFWDASRTGREHLPEALELKSEIIRLTKKYHNFLYDWDQAYMEDIEKLNEIFRKEQSNE